MLFKDHDKDKVSQIWLTEMLSSCESESDNHNSMWSIFLFDTSLCFFFLKITQHSWLMCISGEHKQVASFNFLFSHFLTLQWHICKTS